jgi:hypothetical protein
VAAGAECVSDYARELTRDQDAHGSILCVVWSRERHLDLARLAVAREVAALLMVVWAIGHKWHVPAIFTFAVARVGDSLGVDWTHALLAYDGLRHLFQSDQLPDYGANSSAMVARFGSPSHL